MVFIINVFNIFRIIKSLIKSMMQKVKYFSIFLIITFLFQNNVIAKKKVIYKNEGGNITAEYKKRKDEFSIILNIKNLKGSESTNKNITTVGVKIRLLVRISDSKRYFGMISYFGKDSVFSIHDKDFIFLNEKSEVELKNISLNKNSKYFGSSKPELNGFMQLLSFSGSNIEYLYPLKDSKTLIVKEAGYEKYPGWEFSNEQLELFNKFLRDYIIKEIAPEEIFK